MPELAVSCSESPGQKDTLPDGVIDADIPPLQAAYAIYVSVVSVVLTDGQEEDGHMTRRSYRKSNRVSIFLFDNNSITSPDEAVIVAMILSLY